MSDARLIQAPIVSKVLCLRVSGRLADVYAAVLGHDGVVGAAAPAMRLAISPTADAPAPNILNYFPFQKSAGMASISGRLLKRLN